VKIWRGGQKEIYYLHMIDEVNMLLKGEFSSHKARATVIKCDWQKRSGPGAGEKRQMLARTGIEFNRVLETQAVGEICYQGLDDPLCFKNVSWGEEPCALGCQPQGLTDKTHKFVGVGTAIRRLSGKAIKWSPNEDNGRISKRTVVTCRSSRSKWTKKIRFAS
jgi:hypothetical protein